MVDGSINGCSRNELDNPPYLPGISFLTDFLSNFICLAIKLFIIFIFCFALGDDLSPIYKLTVCMSAKHQAGSHYEFHNAYNLWQGGKICVHLCLTYLLFLKKLIFINTFLNLQFYFSSTAATNE